MGYMAKIKGTGIYVPKKIVTNFDLEKTIDTNDQWIFERTGIKERRVCSTDGGEFPADMAYHASVEALEAANLTPDDIDMIFFASVTPDYKLPSSSTILQTKLGITNKCACIDIAAACSGSVYGLNMAIAMIESGMIKNALVVASEMLSRAVNWKDRSSCILFGDGCGAFIIGKNTTGDSSEILATTLSADGVGRDFFNQEIGGAVTPLDHSHLDEGSHFMAMKGTQMFKVATRTLAKNAKTVTEMAGITLDQVDWLVPHQANIRIIETTGKLLGFPEEKVISNIRKYANTSAASIPLAFYEACKEGKIKKGDIVLFDAFGAGVTSGATLFRY